jgi:peptide/nickel transport system substrate-binding protein
MFRRGVNREPSDKGRWNVYFTILDGLFNSNPATNAALRGDGTSGMPGWPDSPGLEVLRDNWLAAADVAAQRRVGEKMQLQTWQDVPCIPMRHCVRSTRTVAIMLISRWTSPGRMHRNLKFDEVI